MQCPAQILTLQHAPKPTDLIRSLQKRVIPVNGRVLSLDDIFDFPARLSSDILDVLDVPRNEQEMMGIDVARLNEALGLLRTPAAVVLVHQAALTIHEAVQVAAGARKTLTEVVGSHLQNLAANRVA